MKKSVCTTLAVLLCAVSMFSVVGCQKKVANDEYTIEYQLYNGGYGMEWFDQATAKFTEKHPEVKFVKTKGTLQYGQAQTLLSAGPNATTTDLFLGTEPVMKYVLYGDSLVKGVDCVLEDLTDVYNATVEGENVTVKEKMVQGFADYYSYVNEDTGERTYYAYPWIAGVTAIVYNATQFENMGLSVPRTTDELFDVTCETIKRNNKTPFVASQQNSYDNFLWEVWRNQYYSIEGIELYYQGKTYNEESGKYSYSEETFKDIGELYIADAVEKMIGVRYGNMHKNVNTMTFTQAQAQLLLGEGLMYVCGDWLENEMKKQTGNGDTLKYMKTPILSGIINKTPTISDDATLRTVVSYVDGDITQKPAGVSDEDIEYIRQARRIENLSTFQTAYIPSYASAKDMAKEFLKFLATDEIIKICLDATGGSSVPFAYDIRSDASRWNGYSEFIKSKYDLMENAQMVVDPNKYRLQVFGSLRFCDSSVGNGYGYYTSKNASDRNTAQEYYDNRVSYVTRSWLDTALKRAGII